MFNFLGYVSDAFDVFCAIGGFILSLWWIWIPWFLFALARDLWFKHINDKAAQKKDWVLLEIIPPRDIKKTPKAMEQIFAGLHGVQGWGHWVDRNIDGIIPDYFSLELISNEGEIRFLVRVITRYRNLVESNIYAQYPEAEITEVDDYVNLVPDDIPNKDYDLWGTELVLLKEDAYPIRTYADFEKDIILDEQRIDPVASLLETMTNIMAGERIWVQTLIRPVGDTWKKEGEKVINELLGRKEEKKQGILMKEAIGWKDASKEVAHQFVTGNPLDMEVKEESKNKDFDLLKNMTKGEREVVEAIEKNISKIGYEVIIRYVYLCRKDDYRGGSIKRAIMGCYKQFNTQNLNGFGYNRDISPGIDYRIQMKKIRDVYRKKRVFNDYKKRDFVNHSGFYTWLRPLFFEYWPILNWFFIRSKPFVLNTEELATVFHFPAEPVKTPLTPKVEAKKSEPPRGLPVG